jgi:hypothetical protein
MDLDSGVALKVDSPALEIVREQLATEFHGLLTAQDLGPWTPHVTVQNKAEPRAARMLVRAMRAAFEPRPLDIAGFQLIRYSEGEWEPVARYRFRGPRSCPRSRRS